jgi:catechol 2,3-dioxygenase-like lactoylglutathione lyase family enzyme
MSVPRLHHMSLKVSSAEKSAEFYCSLFGFSKTRRYEMDGGGRIYHLEQSRSAAALEIIEDSGPAATSAPKGDAVHLGFSCPDLEAFMRLALQMNIEIVRGPIRVGEETIIFIRDPDGYLLEINDHL